MQNCAGLCVWNCAESCCVIWMMRNYANLFVIMQNIELPGIMLNYSALHGMLRKHPEISEIIRNYSELCGIMQSFAGLCGILRNSLNIAEISQNSSESWREKSGIMRDYLQQARNDSESLGIHGSFDTFEHRMPAPEHIGGSCRG